MAEQTRPARADYLPDKIVRNVSATVPVMGDEDGPDREEGEMVGWMLLARTVVTIREMPDRLSDSGHKLPQEQP